MKTRGFTLIELLVVIAIVAVLSVVVILTLNPAELLRQARDSNRISDLATLKSAVSLYLADVSSPSIGSNNTCGATVEVPTSTTCNTRFTGATIATSQLRIFTIDGTGWVPVNFNAISSGAPLGTLPRDPTNASNSGLFYAYQASSTGLVFEFNANMESSKYVNGGSGDVENTDGGNNANIYEVGTQLTF